MKTIDEAFDRYLGNGKPAYVDKFRIECHQAIELINAAGGIPVLAHPAPGRDADSQQLGFILRSLMELRLQVEQLRRRLVAFARWQARWAGDGWRIECVERTFEPGAAVLDYGDLRMSGPYVLGVVRF